MSEIRSDESACKRHLARAAAVLALAAVAAGCKPREPDGLYIYCDGRADDLHYIDGLNGKTIHEISLCLGPEFVSETGGTGSGEINLAEWTNDTEDIDFLRSMCVASCLNYGGTECGQKDGKSWQIRNYKGLIVPDPLMAIEDPWRLECFLSEANLAPLPWETKIIPDGNAPTWPSNGQPIKIGCEDFATCANEFEAPISMFLYYDDTATTWAADMGYADHLAITLPGSMVELTIVNPGSTPSSDSSEIGGRFEYSVSDCGENICPFYLANMALSNEEDTWELYSESLMSMVYVTDLSVQLRRPTLGVWNATSNEFYVGTERLEVYVSASVQVGTEPPVDMGFLLANVEAIFGEIRSNGTIEIPNFVLNDGGDLELRADLHYGTIEESTP